MLVISECDSHSRGGGNPEKNESLAKARKVAKSEPQSASCGF